ncbi:hypothetical protein [Bacillus vallismortis]|uniref:hypothetical protein n=1 Tax=Bacillus vallismortis TaxID=72361 RepID=UPI00228250A9|nr:hypothetical protein [Bacillus vallismortis]MCY7919899.1 hypothetical protein [Bacillus vallismortis]MCY8533237.1 hypothetical protein [Bacillus vallismortis]
MNKETELIIVEPALSIEGGFSLFLWEPAFVLIAHQLACKGSRPIDIALILSLVSAGKIGMDLKIVQQE